MYCTSGFYQTFFLPLHLFDIFHIVFRKVHKHSVALSVSLNRRARLSARPNTTSRMKSRRVSCRHFLVTPMSPKMASWPWLFLVNLGTSYGSINCARFATRESAGWIENRTIVKAPKTRNILIPKSMGKDWYVIFPSSSLSPHNGAIEKRPKNDKLRLQKAF